MEVLKGGEIGVEIGGRFSTNLIVSGPLDEILQSFALHARVEYFIEVPFFVVFDNDGRHQSLEVTGQRIGVDGFQKGDLED